jgi:hypothetical protein
MKRVDFTHVYGRKESILKHWEFEPCDFQANGQPKAPWSYFNVQEKEFADRSCAELKAGPNASLSQIITPAYVANDEVMVLEVGQRWGTLGVPRQELGTRVYYGPKGKEPLHERERQVESLFMYVGNQMPLNFFVQTPGVVIENGDYIIFPGNRQAIQNEEYPSLPTGYEAGIYYKVVEAVYIANPPRYRFRLSEADNPTETLPISEADKKKYFIYKLNPMYLRTRIGGPAKYMNQKGEFKEGMATLMELPVNQKRDGQYFELGFEADPESEHQAESGTMFFALEKPRPIYQSGESPSTIHGSYFIDYVKLYFKDTPENVKFSMLLNSRHNQIKEVELWFGQIFKDQALRDLDPNGILKFYNALIFRDGSTYGALAERFTADEVTKYFTHHIQDFFRKLYLKPRFLLRGDLDSKINLFGAVMSDASTMRNYTTNALTWDVARCKWQAELHELEPVQTGEQAKAYDENAYDEGYN